jgi:hypothetical protein
VEKRLKPLEDENRRLKTQRAEQLLDNATLKEMLTKNFCAHREENRHELSDRREGLLAAPGRVPWSGLHRRNENDRTRASVGAERHCKEVHTGP